MPVEDSHARASWVAVALSNPGGLRGHLEATPALVVGGDHHQACLASSTRVTTVLVGAHASCAYLPGKQGCNESFMASDHWQIEAGRV
jgi:hypothetical protein